MTPADLLARGRAVATSWWFRPAVVILAVLLLVGAWGRADIARGAAERAAEALRLERAGLAVAAERTERQLRADLAAAEGRSAGVARAEERRVGKEGTAGCCSRLPPVAF